MAATVKHRLLFLSPSAESGEERECKASDFENLDKKPLGEGAFGAVYRVRHKATGKLYAIKLMAKRDIVTNHALPLVRREVRIMYCLNHPYVIKLHNHFEDDRFFYLILELAEGGSLYKYSSKTRGLDEPQVAQFMREIATGVHYLHHKVPPIIHRDIKPENILIDGQGRAKLGDFGWSNFYTEEQRQTLCGTPEYLAPEMINKSGHSTSLDLWNLGILLFEMLAGHAPFRARNGEELYAKILRNKLEFPKNFPAGAKDLVQGLLKSEPSERISIEELLNHPWMQSHPPIRPTVDITSVTETLPLETDDPSVPSERPTIAFQSNEYTIIGNTDSDRSPTTKGGSVEFKRKRVQALEVSYQLKASLLGSVSRNVSELTEFIRSTENSTDLKIFKQNLDVFQRTVNTQRKKWEDLNAQHSMRQTQADELSEVLSAKKRELNGFYTQKFLMTDERSALKRELINPEREVLISVAERALMAVRSKLTTDVDCEAELKGLHTLLKSYQIATSNLFEEEVEKLNARQIIRRKELVQAEISNLEYKILIDSRVLEA